MGRLAAGKPRVVGRNVAIGAGALISVKEPTYPIADADPGSGEFEPEPAEQLSAPPGYAVCHGDLLD